MLSIIGEPAALGDASCLLLYNYYFLRCGHTACDTLPKTKR